LKGSETEAVAATGRIVRDGFSYATAATDPNSK